jgi:hypothetical protein
MLTWRAIRPRLNLRCGASDDGEGRKSDEQYSLHVQSSLPIGRGPVNLVQHPWSRGAREAATRAALRLLDRGGRKVCRCRRAKRAGGPSLSLVFDGRGCHENAAPKGGKSWIQSMTLACRAQPSIGRPGRKSFQGPGGGRRLPPSTRPAGVGRKSHLPASMRRSPSSVIASPSRVAEISPIDCSFSRTSGETA